MSANAPQGSGATKQPTPIGSVYKTDPKRQMKQKTLKSVENQQSM
jgi:hypothetical protein